jgi:hypothetical protein
VQFLFSKNNLIMPLLAVFPTRNNGRERARKVFLPITVSHKKMDLVFMMNTNPIFLNILRSVSMGKCFPYDNTITWLFLTKQ